MSDGYVRPPFPHTFPSVFDHFYNLLNPMIQHTQQRQAVICQLCREDPGIVLLSLALFFHLLHNYTVCATFHVYKQVQHYECLPGGTMWVHHYKLQLQLHSKHCLSSTVKIQILIYATLTLTSICTDDDV